jgi:hypothetical protein
MPTDYLFAKAEECEFLAREAPTQCLADEWLRSAAEWRLAALTPANDNRAIVPEGQRSS